MAIYARKRIAMTVSEAYETLGVTPQDSKDDIQKAYRKKAFDNHPDRGGDTEAMQKINRAKDIIDSGKVDRPSYSRTQETDEDIRKKKEYDDKFNEVAKKANDQRVHANSILKKRFDEARHVFPSIIENALPKMKEYFEKFTKVTGHEHKDFSSEDIKYRKSMFGDFDDIGGTYTIKHSLSFKTEDGFIKIMLYKPATLIYVQTRSDEELSHIFDKITVYTELMKSGKLTKIKEYEIPSILSLMNPESMIPKATMKKVFGQKNTEDAKEVGMKKASAIAYLKDKLPGMRLISETDGLTYVAQIPGTKRYIMATRSTFMGKGSWSAVLTEESNGFSYKMDRKEMGSKTIFEESLSGLNQIVGLYENAKEKFGPRQASLKNMVTVASFKKGEYLSLSDIKNIDKNISKMFGPPENYNWNYPHKDGFKIVKDVSILRVVGSEGLGPELILDFSRKASVEFSKCGSCGSDDLTCWNESYTGKFRGSVRCKKCGNTQSGI